MASYYCDHGEGEPPLIPRMPADWFIMRVRTRRWHGKEAIENRSLEDKSYACCDGCLARAIRILVGDDPNVTIQVRSMRGKAVEQ